MTDTENLKNNELIAKFMGIKTKVYSDTPTVTYWTYNNSMLFVSDLKYHCSWDWIMPVVEKISKCLILGHPPFNFDQYVRVEIVPNGYVKISNLRDVPIITNVSIEKGLISAVFKAVVQFIKWYNKNIKN